MCHRQLRFRKSTACGHLTLTGQTEVDCRGTDCFLTTSHPRTCVAPNCRCRRYYTQPQRIVEGELPGLCPTCASKA